MSAFFGFERPEATLPKAKESATRAVMFDPNLAEAHCSLALSSLFFDLDFNRMAEREFLRALELNPRYLQNLDWYALFYLAGARGRFDEALKLAKEAVEYDPLSAYAAYILSQIYIIAGTSTEAVRVARSAKELEESFATHWGLLVALYCDQQFEQAAATGETALASFGRHVWVLTMQARIFADSGKVPRAKAIYAELSARAAYEYIQPSMLAIVASAAGEVDKAMAHAQEAYEIRDPILLLAKHWPAFARLREDTRFHALLRKINLEP